MNFNAAHFRIKCCWGIRVAFRCTAEKRTREYHEYLYIMGARVICLMQTTTYCVLQSIPGNWNFHKVGGNFWLLCYLSSPMHFPCCNGKLWVKHSHSGEVEEEVLYSIGPGLSSLHFSFCLIPFTEHFNCLNTFIWFGDYNPCTLWIWDNWNRVYQMPNPCTSGHNWIGALDRVLLVV